MKSSGVEWIGEIPEGWEVSRVKNFLSERTGGAWGDEKKNNANDIICLRIADFDYSRFKFNNSTELTIRNYNTDIIEKLLLKKDDILVEKSGGGDKTPVGRAVIFEKTYKALFANFMDRLRVQNNISALFFLYVWTTYYDNKYMLPYVKQTTGIQNLDITSILSGVFFPLPPKSTQQCIASYLDKKCSKIEETIQNQQQVIEKLKAYKQSLITEAVTGKIKIQNGKVCGKYESYKNSGVEWIGKIPSEWSCVQIKNIFRFLGGYAFNSEDYVDETEYQILRIGNVKDFKILFDSSPAYISKETALKVENFKLKAGNILFTMTGTRGKKDYFYTHEITIDDCKRKKLYLNQRVGCLIPKTDIKSSYFNYLLKDNLIKDSVFLNETGTANQANIGSDDVMRIKLHCPPKEEQKEIAEYLDKKCTAIDTAIEQKQKLIEKLTEYKKSLIYECVTGKKEV